jgi:hypothetical protein
VTQADLQLVAPSLIRRTLIYRWVCLGLLFFSGLLAFFTRLAPAGAIPDLREAFTLNPVELGLLTSLYLCQHHPRVSPYRTPAPATHAQLVAERGLPVTVQSLPLPGADR